MSGVPVMPGAHGSAEEPRDDDGAARLAAPALHDVILGAIRGRAPASEVADLAQRTYVRLLKMRDMRELPEDADGLYRLAATVANGLVVDFLRARTRGQSRVVDGAEPDAVDQGAPSSASERVEVRQRLAWVEREVQAGHIRPELVRWARALAEGESYEEIAAREGKKQATVKVAMHRERRKLNLRWQAFAAAAVALGAAWFLWIRPRPPEKDMSPNPNATRPEIPEFVAEPGAGTLETAKALREQAFRDCDAAVAEPSPQARHQYWALCLRNLQTANGLDPDGDRAPRVQEARTRAQEALAKERGHGRE